MVKLNPTIIFGHCSQRDQYCPKPRGIDLSPYCGGLIGSGLEGLSKRQTSKEQRRLNERSDPGKPSKFRLTGSPENRFPTSQEFSLLIIAFFGIQTSPPSRLSQ
jgi:hypothetical protein